MERDWPAGLFQRKYSWALAALILLAVANYVATRVTQDVTTSRIELSLLVGKQSQLFGNAQEAAHAFLDEAERDGTTPLQVELLRSQFIETLDELEQVDEDIRAVLDRTAPITGFHVPEPIRSIFYERPYRIGAVVANAVERMRVVAALPPGKTTSARRVIADPGLTTDRNIFRGYTAASRALEVAVDQSTHRLEVVQLALMLLTLLVLFAEAFLVFAPMRERLRHDGHRVSSAQREIARLTSRDGLTAVANREGFNGKLHAAVADLEKAGGFALLLLDIDRFKSVNDAFGHAAGDGLIVEVARRIAESICSLDTLARLGGDEFAVILRGVADGAASVARMERVRAAVCRPWTWNGFQLEVSVSIGAAVCPLHSSDPDRLLAYAGKALNEAKYEAAHTRVFVDDEKSRSDGEMELMRDLPAAVANGEFELHFQPKINFRDGAVAGVEALVRWRHPQRGLLAPGQFLPLVMRSGRIADLTRIVLDIAGATQAQWLNSGIEMGRVAVNIPEALLTSSLGEHMIREMLNRYGLSGSDFTIEITEDVFLSRSADTIQGVVQAIAALGVRIGFDDFGTGFASLAHLRTFRFDELKIDRSFIAEIGTSAMSEQIIRSLASLARALGKEIVAEGVETAEQYRFLDAEGCTYAQGYLFARPMPAADLELWLVQHRSGLWASKLRSSPARDMVSGRSRAI